jgi:NAD-dependent dihydropyrimidine dehydrogenase PreA subunit
MIRSFIEINEEKCDGCGICVTSCAEGAIQIIDGKAKVVKEEFCDGLGDCIADCPQDALKIIQKDVKAFDEAAAMEHVKKIGHKSKNIHVEHHDHSHGHATGGGCPGSRVRTLKPDATPKTMVTSDGLPNVINKSELTQWPVQLHLVPLKAAFFEGKELLIMATCGPITSADTHWRFVRGRGIIIACPKLDKTENYIEKLAGIFANNNIPKILVARMVVPCCSGLNYMVKEAMNQSGKNIPVEEVVISLEGEVME